MCRFKTVYLPMLLLLMVGSATTAVAQVPPPYTQDFESEPNCGSSCTTICTLATSGWINDTTDNQDWLVDVSGTSSTNTGPSTDHTLGTASGKYLYIETSSPCDSVSGVASLVSPVLDLSGTTSPVVRFWYHMYGVDIGQLHVDVLDAASNPLQLDVASPITDNQDLWQRSPKINLSAFIAQGTVRVRLRAVHSGTGYYGDMAIDDFSYNDDILPDAGVVSIDSPIDCGLGASEPITVTLENVGGSVLNTFDVQYTIDGGVPVVETYPGTLAIGATAQFTFATSADLSIPDQSYVIEVTTLAAGDADPSNDVATRGLYNGQIRVAPFLEDFEGATAATDWVSGGAGDDWMLGTPADTLINTAYSGANAWVTDLNLSYNSYQQSFVRSRCGYDFSTVTNPAVRLAVFYEVETTDDGAVLQASIDGGASWITIGSMASGINWYNETAITALPGGQGAGWTGRDGLGSGGWVIATHEMTAFAGEPNVMLRVAFGSDSSTTDEGFAFDDLQVFDNQTDGVDILGIDAPQAPVLGAIPAAAPATLVQAFELHTRGPGAKDVTSITLTNTGNIADAELTWSLYADDGDGAFEPATDPLLQTVPQAAGLATFTNTGTSIGTLAVRRYWVAVNLTGAATFGATFGSEIANLAMDLVIAGNPPAAHIGGPLLGDTFDVGERVSLLPFFDNFSTEHAALRSVTAAQMRYPTAPSAGTTVDQSAVTPFAATPQLLPTWLSLSPVQGTNLLAITYPQGEATGAVQYAFDLSGYSAAADPIWLTIRYGDDGVDADEANHVFISLDGGLTWLGSLHDFAFQNVSDEQWVETTIDLAATLASFGADFTDNVVIRLQANDNQDTEAFLLDAVTVGRAPLLQVERPMSTVIADDATEVLGIVPAAPTTLSYTVRNLGDLDVELNSILLLDVSGTASISVTPPAQSTLVAGGFTTFDVSYEPQVGPFSFRISIQAAAPNLGDGEFNTTVTGTGAAPEPEIDVQRPAGTSLPSGGSDPQGLITDDTAQSLTYTVENTGAVDLALGQIRIEADTNVLAFFTTLPDTSIAPQQSTTLDVGYIVQQSGAFAFTVAIDSNDSDEPTYHILVTGDAELCSDATEICNDVDDDCDPSTPDGADEPTVGDACDGPDSDLCAEGTVQCTAGVIACSDDTDDTVEVCNGTDDDCDGEIDEDDVCGTPDAGTPGPDAGSGDDGDGDSGCGCHTRGGPTDGAPLGLILIITLIGLVARRRAQRS